jgi:ABC-type molybdate transport system substrate-binding protein
MVLLHQAKQKPAALAFYDFMLGSEAKHILLKYGYRP